MPNQTTIIIGDVGDTKSDTLCLSHPYAQLTHLRVATLVCPFSRWHGRGFYVELFLINAFASAHQFKT